MHSPLYIISPYNIFYRDLNRILGVFFSLLCISIVWSNILLLFLFIISFISRMLWSFWYRKFQRPFNLKASKMERGWLKMQKANKEDICQKKYL